MTCDIGHTWDVQGSILGVLDTPMSWYARLPGMDCRDLGGEPVMINRFFAFMCAQRIIGIDVTRTRSNSDAIKEQATKMFWWLLKAQDPVDGYMRRMFLGEACEKVMTRTSGISIGNYLMTAQWAYEQMTKMLLPQDMRRANAAA